MKRLLAILTIMMMLGGCTGPSWLCRHKVEITTGLEAVIATAGMLKLMPGVPEPVIELCQQAASLAQFGLLQACPDVANLSASQSKLAEAVGLAKAMGYKLSK